MPPRLLACSTCKSSSSSSIYYPVHGMRPGHREGRQQKQQLLAGRAVSGDVQVQSKRTGGLHSHVSSRAARNGEARGREQPATTLILLPGPGSSGTMMNSTHQAGARQALASQRAPVNAGSAVNLRDTAYGRHPAPPSVAAALADVRARMQTATHRAAARYEASSNADFPVPLEAHYGGGDMATKLATAAFPQPNAQQPRQHHQTGSSSVQPLHEVILGLDHNSSGNTSNAIALHDAMLGLDPTGTAVSLRSEQVQRARATASPSAAGDPQSAVARAVSEELGQRLQAELAQLQSRLAALKQAADAKLQQLSQQAKGPEGQDRAKRAVLEGAHKLVAVQYNADSQEIQRQIAAVKADTARQQLQLQQWHQAALLAAAPSLPGAAAVHSSMSPSKQLVEQQEQQQRQLPYSLTTVHREDVYPVSPESLVSDIENQLSARMLAASPGHASSRIQQGPASRSRPAVAATQQQLQQSTAGNDDDDDDRRSEISRMSADLEAQREELLLVLETRKRELARKKRAEKVRAKEQHIAQLQHELQQVEGMLLEVDDAPGSTTGAAAAGGRDQTTKPLQQLGDIAGASAGTAAAGGNIKAKQQVDDTMGSVPQAATDSRDQATKLPVRLVPDAAARQRGASAEVQRWEFAHGRTQEVQQDQQPRDVGAGAAVPQVPELAGQNAAELAHAELATSGLSGLEEEHARRIAQLKKQVQDKQRQARELQLLREEEALRAELRSLDATIAASTLEADHQHHDQHHQQGSDNARVAKRVDQSQLQADAGVVQASQSDMHTMQLPQQQQQGYADRQSQSSSMESTQQQGADAGHGAQLTAEQQQQRHQRLTVLSHDLARVTGSGSVAAEQLHGDVPHALPQALGSGSWLAPDQEGKQVANTNDGEMLDHKASPSSAQHDDGDNQVDAAISFDEDHDGVDDVAHLSQPDGSLPAPTSRFLASAGGHDILANSPAMMSSGRAAYEEDSQGSPVASEVSGSIAYSIQSSAAEAQPPEPSGSIHFSEAGYGEHTQPQVGEHSVVGESSASGLDGDRVIAEDRFGESPGSMHSSDAGYAGPKGPRSAGLVSGGSEGSLGDAHTSVRGNLQESLGSVGLTESGCDETRGSRPAETVAEIPGAELPGSGMSAAEEGDQPEASGSVEFSEAGYSEPAGHRPADLAAGRSVSGLGGLGGSEDGQSAQDDSGSIGLDVADLDASQLMDADLDIVDLDIGDVHVGDADGVASVGGGTSNEQYFHEKQGGNMTEQYHSGAALPEGHAQRLSESGASRGASEEAFDVQDDEPGLHVDELVLSYDRYLELDAAEGDASSVTGDNSSQQHGGNYHQEQQLGYEMGQGEASEWRQLQREPSIRPPPDESWEGPLDEQQQGQQPGFEVASPQAHSEEEGEVAFSDVASGEEELFLPGASSYQAAGSGPATHQAEDLAGSRDAAEQGPTSSAADDANASTHASPMAHARGDPSSQAPSTSLIANPQAATLPGPSSIPSPTQDSTTSSIRFLDALEPVSIHQQSSLVSPPTSPGAPAPAQQSDQASSLSLAGSPTAPSGSFDALEAAGQEDAEQLLSGIISSGDDLEAVAAAFETGNDDDELDVHDSDASLLELQSSGEELYQYNIVMDTSPVGSPRAEEQAAEGDSTQVLPAPVAGPGLVPAVEEDDEEAEEVEDEDVVGGGVDAGEEMLPGLRRIVAGPRAATSSASVARPAEKEVMPAMPPRQLPPITGPAAGSAAPVPTMQQQQLAGGMEGAGSAAAGPKGGLDEEIEELLEEFNDAAFAGPPAAAATSSTTGRSDLVQQYGGSLSEHASVAPVPMRLEAAVEGSETGLDGNKQLGAKEQEASEPVEVVSEPEDAPSKAGRSSDGAAGDYSLDFEEQVSVPAEAESSAGAISVSEPEKGKEGSGEDVAGDYTISFDETTSFGEDIEVYGEEKQAGGAAAPGADSASVAGPSSSSAPSADWASSTMRRGGLLQYPEDGSDEGDAPWGEPAASLGTLPALSGQKSQQPKLQSRDGGSSSGSSPGNSIGEDDLGWGGDEGSLDDYDLDLGSMIVPQHEQDLIRQSAAPSLATTPAYIASYVDSVVQDFLAAGNIPEFLMPGQEPLGLEGYLNLERANPETSSEALHIVHKALYDAVNEAILGVYRAANRVQIPSWVKRDQLVRPLPSPAALLELVKQKVVGWTQVKVVSEADVEKILPLDAAEEERTWADTAEEEAELKLEVAELLWDDLLSEVAQELIVMDRKLRGRRSSSGGGWDRRGR